MFLVRLANANISCVPRQTKILSESFVAGLQRPWVHIRSASSISANSLSNLKDEIKSLDSMPGPPSWPLIGNLEIIRRGTDIFHLIQLERAKKYKGIYKDKIFGQTLVFLNDPDIAEKLFREEEKWPPRDLSQEFGEYFNTRRKLSLPAGIFELQGEEWAKVRSIMNQHMLKPLNIKNYYPGFNYVALDALANLSRMRDSNQIVEDVYQDLIGKWSMESLATFAFGQRVGLLDNPPSERSLETYEGMKAVFATSYKISRAPWLRYVYPFTARKLRNDMQKLYENGMYFINNVFKHLKDSVENGTTIDKDMGTSLVAYLMKRDGITQAECATHAIDSYSAGLDTTSITAFWLMYLLGLNTEKQEKLYEEVNSVITSDNIFTYSDVQKMPYLRACFKESARLQPTLSGFYRIFNRDIVLEGYLIPAGTRILIEMYAMGKDENLFPDAYSFKPERWLRGDKNAEKIHQFAVKPFGFGSRSCIGKQVAEARMQVLISQLVKKFRFEFLDKKQLGRMTLLIEPEKPRRFAFYDR